MKITLNLFGLSVLLLALLAIFSIGRRIGIRNGESALEGVTQSLGDAVQSKREYVIQVDSLKEYVSQINAVTVINDRTIKQLEDTNDRLSALNIKKADLIANLTANVNVLNKKLLSKDTIIVVKNVCDTLDDSNYLKIPLDLLYEDKWSYNNVSIDSVGSFTTYFGLKQSDVHIILGDQKESVFKSKVGVMSITTPNPYLVLTPNQVIVVQPKKKIYQRQSVWLGVGVILGYFVL